MSPLIVWIEDDVYSLDGLVRPLRHRGYEILVLDSMSDALNHIDTIRESALILLDLIIPGGSEETTGGYYTGITLLERLRDQGVTTPVLALSVARTSLIVARLEVLGVSGVLQKPLLPAALEAKVLEVLTKEP